MKKFIGCSTMVVILVLAIVTMSVFGEEEDCYETTSRDGLEKISDLAVYFKEVKAVGIQGDYPVTFIMLHGAKFSVTTWDSIDTLQKLARNGYKVFAVDLPGYGKSREHRSFNVDQVKFMADLVSTVGEGKTILVSPSMSGTYAVPYINAGGQGLDGWVAAAPNLMGLSPTNQMESSLEVLAFYGENDPRMQDIPMLTKSFSKTTQVVVPNGPHPAYLKDPELWHKSLKELAVKLTSSSEQE
eukprot:TRINITY_DN7607_c0_g2_i2.p1 TRINITY_DN7607_c0_g2~~TRINITY_DN7607_c0_g2_i2.p1  ORF type:complete len:263 (-),score=37.27 TRINITY_DN7607_c0_g2_i2:209-934(-)